MKALNPFLDEESGRLGAADHVARDHQDRAELAERSGHSQCNSIPRSTCFMYGRGFWLIVLQLGSIWRTVVSLRNSPITNARTKGARAREPRGVAAQSSGSRCPTPQVSGFRPAPDAGLPPPR